MGGIEYFWSAREKEVERGVGKKRRERKRGSGYEILAIA